MMSSMKSLFSIAAFILTVFIVHYLFNITFQNASISLKKLIKIQGFVLISTTIVVLITLKVIYSKPDKTGFTYLGLVLFKMVTAIVFLFPFLTDVSNETKKLVVHFFIVLFIYLIYEVVFLLRHLNAEQKK